MDRPLQIRIRPSRIAQYYCLFVLLLSWSAVLLAGLPQLVQMLLCVVAAVYTWRAASVLKIPLLDTLEYRSGCWSLKRINDVTEVELERQFFLGAGIIVLPFRLPSGQYLRLVLWPDSADRDSLRRLRASLLAQRC